MTTILDYYEYAKLATAAYVQVEDEPNLTGDRIAFQANRQERIPIRLAERMFDSRFTSSPWTIPSGGYHGNDPTGFAATLFERTEGGVTEKVLALRGTEPSGSVLDPASQFSLDLLTADLAGIGVLGVAVTQLVEMVNTLLLWSTPADSQAVQLKLNVSNTEPAVAHSLQVPGTSGAPVYFYSPRRKQTALTSFKPASGSR